MHQFVLLLAMLNSIWFETHDVDIQGHVGRIAVRVYVSTVPRYSDGSPIVVGVPGGTGPSFFIRPNEEIFKAGITFVTFLLPGATDSITGRTSEGTYDKRGMNCITTLYDVLRYAHGDIPDLNGQRITELSEFPIDTSTIGMIGYSNGGNLTVVTLDIWGDSLGFVDYVVNWESPTSGQTVVVELGGRDHDTRDGNHNGFPYDDRVNPYYTAYGDTSCEVDYSRIRYDSRLPANQAVFLDGNGNDSLDLDTLPNGFVWEDINNNGILDYGEDYQLACESYNGLYFYTREATRALRSILTSWPSELADTHDVDTFWWYREAVMHFDGAAAKLPHLGVILVFSEDDHVQAAPDKPHIHQGFNGWYRNGVWVRLNPDSSYVAAVLDRLPATPTDNPANTEPSDWNDIVLWAHPEEFPNGVMCAAAIAELCDRSKFDVWDPDLDSVIAPPRTPLLFNFVLHIEENASYLERPHLMPYSDGLQEFAETLAAHGGVAAFQLDWTFIEGVARNRPGFLTYLESLGHEVTPHAHEGVYSLREVKILLQDAGVANPWNGNGHFMAPYWDDYMAEIAGLPHSCLNKNVYTQKLAAVRMNPWRPKVDTVLNEWLTHDPSSPLVFLVNKSVKGTPLLYDSLTENLLKGAASVDPVRVNAQYCWLGTLEIGHTIREYVDSLSVWLNTQADSLVHLGVLQWARMDDIYHAYLNWEATHPGVPPFTDTMRVDPGDTATYTSPSGWEFYTEWWDTLAGDPVLSNNVITSLAIDRYGKLWVGTLGGITIYDGTSWTWVTPHNSNLPAWFIRTIAPSYDGVWVGTDYAGLVKLDFDGNLIGHWDTTGGVLPSVGVHAVLVASDSSVWVGMFHGGVAVLRHGVWNYYTTADGLPDMDVFAIEEHNGTIYVGTSGGGVAMFDGTGFVPLPQINPPSASGLYVHALESTPWGLVAGTHGSGVAIWDESAGTWNCIGPDSMISQLNAIKPHGLFFLNDTLYVATYFSVVWRYDGYGWDSLPVPSNGQSTNAPHSILVDTFRNILWVGTNRGLKAHERTPSVEENEPNMESNLPKLAVSDRQIKFFLPKEAFVRLRLFDITGREAAELANGTFAGGWHKFELPDELPSGVYIAKLQTEDAEIKTKILKIKR